MAEDFFQRFDEELQRRYPAPAAAAAAPAPVPAPAAGGIPTWVWAVGGAVVVLLLAWWFAK
jgi:hypothetical protein